MQAGLGGSYLVTPTIALTVGVRFHHIFNANIGERNLGVNGTLTYLGLSFFFPSPF